MELCKHLTIIPAAVNYFSYVNGCQRCFIVVAAETLSMVQTFQTLAQDGLPVAHIATGLAMRSLLLWSTEYC